MPNNNCKFIAFTIALQVDNWEICATYCQVGSFGDCGAWLYEKDLRWQKSFLLTFQSLASLDGVQNWKGTIGKVSKQIFYSHALSQGPWPIPVWMRLDNDDKQYHPPLKKINFRRCFLHDSADQHCTTSYTPRYLVRVCKVENRIRLNSWSI